MDPISACAAVIGAVSQAIDIGFTIYNLIDGIKSMPDDVRRLGVEMQGLYQVLTLLSSSLEAQKSKATSDGFPVHMINNIKELVENCIGVFYEIKVVVKPYMESEKSVVKQWKKGFKWVVAKEETVITLQRALGNNKLTLELAISTLNLFNTTQTVDMVAGLQRDVRRLRRQINHRDKSVTDPRDTKLETAYTKDPYSIPMQRFLARTASVASRMSTSTRINDLDSVFSEELCDISEATYADVGTPEFYKGASAEYYLEAEKATPTSFQEEVKYPEPSVSAIRGLDATDTSRTFPQSKVSTWKKIRNRMRTSKSTDAVEVPETEVQEIPANRDMAESTAPTNLETVNPEPPSLDQQPITHSPTSIEDPNAHGSADETAPDGSELTKSKSTPMLPCKTSHYGNLGAPLPYRSNSTPLTTLSSLGVVNPYEGSAFSQSHSIPTAQDSGTDSPVDKAEDSHTQANDRDALLSSLRQPSPDISTAVSAPITDPETPCRGCKSPIEDSKHYRLKDDVWHAHCFRCSSCNVRLHSDSLPPFLLKDDFLVCNSCSFNCQKCDDRIEEHGTKDGYNGSLSMLQNLPGPQNCPGLFFCHECYKSIKNLRYVRSTQGVFCLACHSPIMSDMERSRRERERERLRPVPVLVG
ncbi:hypothetical protein BDV96DRAFT_645511 [Lophiotrema nucula]|uniref:LIM zinc-binding domain-containing protein n=1 Tax=Lophiotrema nucula TaxID=690887 RepID=A0A6A5Z9P4_9PLEO|nr:hypothetical protein BDV96DRAFT_645511 [Lophiotrema nucula]